MNEQRNLIRDAIWTAVFCGMFWVVFGEYTHRHPLKSSGRTFAALYGWFAHASALYEVQRQWVCEHPALDALIALGLLALGLVARRVYLLWHNIVLPRIHGTELVGTDHKVPFHKFDLLEEIRKRPPGHYFLGLGSGRKPVYVTEAELGTHLHVTGPTGTGKTKSTLNPLVLQDALAGKGVAYLDAKGAIQNIVDFKTIAAVAGRARDVRVLSIEHPEDSNTYNPLHLGAHGDPLCVAERVFSDFAMENAYYRGQSKLLFYNLVRVMADTAKPFNLIDVRIAVSDPEALDYAMEISSDRRAKYNIRTQMELLGKRRLETFTGLHNALADYDPGGEVSRILNSYNPDIIIEDVVDKRQMVYFDLPSNRYALLAPAIGRIVLRQLSSVGCERDTKPNRYDRHPFSIKIDEAHEFLFMQLLKSLTMLRSADMQFCISHQDRGQLKAIADHYDTTTWVNTRLKIQYHTLDPDHMELISKSYGTKTVHKKTVRFGPGAFFTHINTGEASTREVQEFVVHPDALKALAPCGQAFLMRPSGVEPISFAMLPPMSAGNYTTMRKPEVDGLNLIEKFVDKRHTDCA